HRDLRAWREADGVRRQVIAMCSEERVRKDFAFCDQAQRAAASACRNLAEGFARYRHADFARFVTIAYASLTELLDSLDEARIKGYLSATAHEELNQAVQAAMRTAGALRSYLQRTPTPK
ncbi:MAG: four helix bundle protein, partial [Acidobacteria bacterium]|nr:four helix bundle protein [Acidobacteriota bacterium]